MAISLHVTATGWQLRPLAGDPGPCEAQSKLPERQKFGLHWPNSRAGSCDATQNVSSQPTMSRLVVPVALLALLIGTTLGFVWHHHATSSADNCSICHLSHQAIEPAPVSARVFVLLPTGTAPETKALSFPVRNAARNVPARAPPA